ncbi:Abi-alpha family protein [Terriglobus sp. TAA 43]|uniref:Abi-alpha family protein n=1 Tax=Terriglobus sp. TAA 43 TaxID=278961 RepID=UPI000646BF80|nr:Abi-alpha family protein [Terriglobus sp. TAA 43]
MNPDEIVKAGSLVAKSAAGLGIAIPFTGVVKRMLGPASDEIAEMMRDQIRLYRYERQLACVEKAAKMAESAGIKTGPVAPKILFPLLEGASFEENEEIHTMWATLLANAASLSGVDEVRPAYIAMLKQLAIDEARLLNELFSIYENRNINGKIPRTEFDLGEMQTAYIAGFPSQDDSNFYVCVANLEAANLIAKVEYSTIAMIGSYCLTFRGFAFGSACRAPRKVSGDQ